MELSLPYYVLHRLLRLHQFFFMLPFLEPLSDVTNEEHIEDHEHYHNYPEVLLLREKPEYI